MMSSNEADDDKLKFNDPSELDSVEDVSFPGYAHHLTVRAELTELQSRGVIDGEQGDEIYNQWRSDR